MPSRDLPVNIESQYADSLTDPSRKIHQGHHDVIHAFVNLFDDGAPPDGAVFFYVAATGLWTAIDPAISGSPGPQGDTGVGFSIIGDWNSGTTYHQVSVADVYELVRYSGHIYLCLVTNTNSVPDATPADTASWMVFVESGADGAPGADGSTGPQGATGSTGPPGPSEEVLASIIDVAGTYTMDAGDATGYVLTMTDDTTFSLADSSASAFSAVTLRLYQGTGAPYVATFPDVTFWNTADNNPPDLSALGDGDVTIIVFDQMAGVWFGHSRAASGPPAPEVIPTLTIDSTPLVAQADSTNKTIADRGDGLGIITYTLGTSIQLGNKRGGSVAITTTRSDSTMPAIPALAGMGATWVQGVSRTWGTGTTRRCTTWFHARDAVSGTAAPLVVTILDTALAAYSGCVALGYRTGGIVSDTWRSLCVSKGVQLAQGDATTVSTAPKVTLGAASNAANRGIVVEVQDSTDASTTPFTPEANWVVQGAPTLVAMTSPTICCRILYNSTAFDTTFTSTLGLGAAWVCLATEYEQG